MQYLEVEIRDLVRFSRANIALYGPTLQKNPQPFLLMILVEEDVQNENWNDVTLAVIDGGQFSIISS